LEINKVVLIGAGEVSTPYFAYLSKNKKVNLSAVCDLNKDRAVALAKRFSVPNVYSDSAEMLSKEQPAIVFILTSPKSHMPLAVQTMQAGAHVFMEKPMALSVKECDEIISVSKATGKTVGVNHNRLFLRTVKRAKAMVDSGEIGTLNGVEIRFIQRARELDNENHWAHKLKGGAFAENCPHAIYLSRAFLGDVEVAAAAFSKQGNRPGMQFDELRVILNSPKAPGIIIHSFNAPRDYEMIDIYGSKANIHLVMDSLFIKYGTAARSSFSYACDYFSQSAQIITSTLAAMGRYPVMAERSFGRQESIQRFLDAIQNKTTPPVTASDGKAQAQILEEIIKKSGIV
jgi:predicted dehydrogenase